MGPGKPWRVPALATIGMIAPAAGSVQAATPIIQDVRIASDAGVTLAGTLRIPAGRGPFPVTIFFAGTGPYPRGGYQALSDRLLADGIATLDYDKRGIGQSTGTFLDSLPLIERDAAAAVAWLRTRRDIDGGRIALAGLSQGATVSASIAARDPKIAAIVMLSGPVGPRADFLLDGMRDKLVAGGMPLAAAQQIADAMRALMDARLRGANPIITARLRLALAEAFVAGGFSQPKAEQSVAQLDTPAGLALYDTNRDEIVRHVRAPVLAIYGEQDELLTVGRVIPAAKAALAANPDATVIALPGLNHALMHQRPDRDGARPFPATEVTDRVDTWLARHLLPAAAAK